jgi:hypothetical protein
MRLRIPRGESRSWTWFGPKRLLGQTPRVSSIPRRCWSPFRGRQPPVDRRYVKVGGKVVPVSAAVDKMTFIQVVRATAEAGLVGDVSRSHEHRCLWRPHAPSEQVTGPPVRRPGSSRAGSRRAVREPASPASHGSLDSQSIVRAHPTVRRSGCCTRGHRVPSPE